MAKIPLDAGAAPLKKLLMAKKYPDYMMASGKFSFNRKYGYGVVAIHSERLIPKEQRK